MSRGVKRNLEQRDARGSMILDGYREEGLVGKQVVGLERDSSVPSDIVAD